MAGASAIPGSQTAFLPDPRYDASNGIVVRSMLILTYKIGDKTLGTRLVREQELSIQSGNI